MNAKLCPSQLRNSYTYLALARRASSQTAWSLTAREMLAQAHNRLGLQSQAQNLKEQALIHYKQAIHIQPDFTPAYYNLGYCLAEMGRSKEAVLALQSYLRHARNDRSERSCIPKAEQEILFLRHFQ